MGFSKHFPFILSAISIATSVLEISADPYLIHDFFARANMNESAPGSYYY